MFLDTHLGKRKNLIFNNVRQMAKNHCILPTHSNVTSKIGFTLAGPPCTLLALVYLTCRLTYVSCVVIIIVLCCCL